MFPAMMSDGSLYTDWLSSSQKEGNIKKEHNIKDNYEYRQWLTNNAKSVMTQNKSEAYSDCGLTYTPINMPISNNKYIFRDCNDIRRPFGYETSDLKSIYTSRQELQERLDAPIMNQEQLLRSGIGNHF